MCPASRLTILGAGPAGLATGYYAKKKGISFRMFDAADAVGGNCRSFRWNDFLFDAGAHRFHDKLPDITAEVRQLLGKDLLSVVAPNTVYYRGQQLRFPLSPLDMIRKLGMSEFGYFAIDTARARLSRRTPVESFKEYTERRYGKRLAEAFLLNYTKKLWGVSADSLLQEISGTRLKGLTLRSLLLEAVFGTNSASQHLEGSRFYYPRLGYGSITEQLAQAAGTENIFLNSRVVSLQHSGNRISSIVVESGGRQEEVVIDGSLVSTLPAKTFLMMFDPPAPDPVRSAAEALMFRDVLLVAIFLNRPSVTSAATMYFPEANIPFSRISEPKNRSAALAPQDQTSLIVEIPWGADNPLFSRSKEEIVAAISTRLEHLGFYRQEEVLGTTCKYLPQAYPVLDLESRARMKVLDDYFSRFENLSLLGRNSRFNYSSLHDAMQWAKELIDRNAA